MIFKACTILRYTYTYQNFIYTFQTYSIYAIWKSYFRLWIQRNKSAIKKYSEISMWTFPRKSFCIQHYCVLSILCVLRKGPSFFSAASYIAYELVGVEIAEYRSLKVVMNFFVRKPAFTSFLSLLCDFAFYFNYTICNFVLFMHSCSTTKNAASTKV